MEDKASTASTSKATDNNPQNVDDPLIIKPAESTEAKPAATKAKNNAAHQEKHSWIFGFRSRFHLWNERRKERKWRRKNVEPPKWTDKAIVILTLGIVIWAGFQWWEMHDAGRITTAIRGAADKQAAAAESFSSTAIETSGSIHKAESDFQAMAKNSERSIRTSQKTAKESLDASISAIHLGERPWVTTSHFLLSNEPEEKKGCSIKVWMVNTGKTPALEVIPKSRVFSWLGEPPITDFDTAIARDVKAISQGVLAPGQTEVSFTTATFALNASQLAAYVSGANNLYIHTWIEYSDIFNKPHWTKGCIVHIHGKPLDEFVYCNSGNDVDHDEKR